MKTTVHILGVHGDACSLCGTHIPHGHGAAAGEYVGVIDSLGGKTPYRIGSNNRDPLCNGAPSSEFHQESHGRTQQTAA